MGRQTRMMIENCYPVLLTVAELANHLRIGTTAAYQLCQQPGFPAARIGRLIRVPAAALERWIEEQAEAPKRSDAE